MGGPAFCHCPWLLGDWGAWDPDARFRGQLRVLLGRDQHHGAGGPRGAGGGAQELLHAGAGWALGEGRGGGFGFWAAG